MSKRPVVKSIQALRIYHEGVGAGHILFFKEKSVKHEDLVEGWGGFDPLPSTISKPFDYLWVEEVFVHRTRRGLGLAREALKELERRCKGLSVIALGIGEIDNVKQADLITFYEKAGFNTLKTVDGVYAIKVINQDSAK